jgi:hypothetical protein
MNLVDGPRPADRVREGVFCPATPGTREGRLGLSRSVCYGCRFAKTRTRAFFRAVGE